VWRLCLLLTRLTHQHISEGKLADGTGKSNILFFLEFLSSEIDTMRSWDGKIIICITSVTVAWSPWKGEREREIGVNWRKRLLCRSPSISLRNELVWEMCVATIINASVSMRLLKQKMAFVSYFVSQSMMNLILYNSFCETRKEKETRYFLKTENLLPLWRSCCIIFLMLKML
jgi:hypothetical protein